MLQLTRSFLLLSNFQNNEKVTVENNIYRPIQVNSHGSSANHLMVIFFCCRQVVPSPDNLAANSLASDIQERDVRKVKMSAKVTLAIWVLETISFAVLFVTKHIYQNHELLSTVSILLLHVVIPFIFLANSSENRERLADFRFLNVIPNTIGIHPKMQYACHQWYLPLHIP